MNFHQPIVERELRVAARRPGTYWTRAGFGLLAMCLVLWALWMGGLSPAAGPMVGRGTFQMLTFVALIGAIGTALRLTAPAIAAEKREGTLGLLFLTDLKPRDVVLGKLAVTSLATLYRFLAIVPVLGIPILLGGVTAGDFGRLVLVLLNLMFLASAVGMFTSTLSVDEKGASGLGVLGMIFVMGAGPLVALLAWRLGVQDEEILRFLGSTSPGYACFNIMSSPWGPGGFWTSLITGHLCAWFLLWWTCRLLPRIWQDRPATATQARRGNRFRDLTQGDTSARRRLRDQLLSINPLLWLNSRERALRWYPWVFLAGVAALMIWITLKFDATWKERGLALAGLWILNMIFKVWISSQSSAALSADRDRGALELLLSTPLTTQELIHGHWLTLKRLFAAPLGFLLACEFIWVLYVLLAGTDEAGLPLGFWITAFALTFIVFFADLLAVGWLGLWTGVRSKNSGQAAGHTQWQVLILPCILVLISMAFAAITFHIYNALPWYLGFWVFWSLLFDAIWIRHALWHLDHSLRAAAIERYSTAPGATGWFKNLLRRFSTRPLETPER